MHSAVLFVLFAVAALVERPPHGRWDWIPVVAEMKWNAKEVGAGSHSARELPQRVGHKSYAGKRDRRLAARASVTQSMTS